MVNKKKNTYSARETADLCNNLVIKALRPNSLGEIPEARLRKLRAYSQGLVAPMIKHMEQEILRAEEIVAILGTAALFVQLKYVMRSEKLPCGPMVTEIYDGPEVVVLPEDYLSVGEPENDEILPRVGKPARKKKKA